MGDLGVAVGEDVVAFSSEAILLGVEVSHNSALNIRERVLLDEDLGAHARVDSGNAAVVAGAVDVGGAEANGRQARVDLGEGVMVIGDLQLACVLGRGAVTMSNTKGTDTRSVYDLKVCRLTSL